MIFGAGVVLMIIGWFLVNAFGAGPFRDNAADYVGIGAFGTGFIMSLGSLLNFTAKVLA